MGFGLGQTLIRGLSPISFILLCPIAFASPQQSCSVPLTEKMSAPAVDLIMNRGGSPSDPGSPIDRDQLLDQIAAGFDSSTLEPQLSKIYRGQSLRAIEYPPLSYPEQNDPVDFLNPLPGTDGLVRARVALHSDPARFFQMNLSLDTHAALVRNALFRKLGYAIPSPRYYKTIKVNFKSLEDRDAFLDQLSSDTLTTRSRWVKESLTGDQKNLLTLTLQDLVLEPALIEVPQLHWGILTPEVLNSRRSLRALLVPLTLVDIPESVNLYSFEPAKIYNEAVLFSRSNADAFKNETSIGDVRWIARKIAKFTRADWTEILRAGSYPADIESLLIEKTLGRVNQLMGILGIDGFVAHRFNRYLTYGDVINGKATRENYDGYALRFTYGDPESPLRASELARFFGITVINGAITAILEKANTYLQFIKPDQYITEHQNKAIQAIFDHFQNHPNEPYVQPIEIWGGPVVGGSINASRNIVTGTYYGSESPIQLVDALSASVNVGGFFGVSGIPRFGGILSPTAQGTRSYVHVRPLPSLKSAWKDSWGHLMVPKFMFHLSKILAGDHDQTASDAMKAFLDQLNPGEMFIVTDAIAASTSVTGQVPLGALIGFMPSFGTLSASASVGGNYGILSRTTLIRTKDGLQIYIQRSKSGSFEIDLAANFIFRVIDLNENVYRGSAHTRAFILPEKFDDEEKSKSFQKAVRAILRNDDPSILEEDFASFNLDHKANGNRFKISLGPFSWVQRLNFHRLEITPPVDSEGRYKPEDFKRTVIDGQLTRVSGSDLYGFFGSLVRGILPLFKLPQINLGGSAKGDDPSSNFLGRSRTLTVSTQIEITPSRDSRPFMKIEQALSGWSMLKNRLLRLIAKISDQLLEYNPHSGLINPAEFSQTKKVQSYRVSWDLLIYQNGIQKLLTLLNLNETGTAQTQQRLINLMGQDQYDSYCKDHDLNPVFARGPVAPPELEGIPGTVIEASKGQVAFLGCVTPFMESVYRLRSKLNSNPAIFNTVTKTEDEAKEKIRALNQAVLLLTHELELGELIRVVGKENAFFQSRISGFRTHDENGDSEYFSNTIGLIDQEQLAGPLSDIASESQISSNEIEARYLSNGY